MGFNHHVIRTYCLNHHIPISKFAKQVGKSKTHIFNIIWGKQKVSPELSMRIEDITSGEIKASDLTENEIKL